MPTTTVATALDRIARLIPVTAAGTASQLTGIPVWVLTHPGDLPDGHDFRTAQAARRLVYFHTGQRVPAGEELASVAPRYVVTSYGVPIAWVTLDGRTHFATLTDSMPVDQFRAMRRHRNAVHAAWPARFILNSEGDPQTRLYPDGVMRLVTEPSFV